MRRRVLLLSLLLLIPVLSPVGVPLPSVLPAAHAQTRDVLMYYRTFPGENLEDVVRKLGTTATVVRRLNADKIGPDGTIEPYTLLSIPTSPRYEGLVRGAPDPDGAAPAVEAAPVPERPTAAAPAPPADPEVIGPAPDDDITAPPVASPGPLPDPPADDSGVTIAEAPPGHTYETRESAPGRAGPTTAEGIFRAILALAVIIGLIYGAGFVIKRFGLEESLAALGNRGGKAPAGRRNVRRSRGPGWSVPSRGSRRDEEDPAPDVPEEQHDFRSHLADADASQKSGDGTLRGPVQKTDTNTSISATETDPDDDLIPETSLEDALRRRRRAD